jgi:hypothetical protein
MGTASSTAGKRPETYRKSADAAADRCHDDEREDAAASSLPQSARVSRRGMPTTELSELKDDEVEVFSSSWRHRSVSSNGSHHNASPQGSRPRSAQRREEASARQNQTLPLIVSLDDVENWRPPRTQSQKKGNLIFSSKVRAHPRRR